MTTLVQARPFNENWVTQMHRIAPLQALQKLLIFFVQQPQKQTHVAAKNLHMLHIVT